MATIDDVAREAGVSKSTVSNVFSQKRPISKEVTERVLLTAERLSYKPNYWARSLAGKEKRILGLNMRSEQVKFGSFHMLLINGVLKECYERGYRLLINTLSKPFTHEREFWSTDPVDGEILLDPMINDPRLAERMKQKLPVVIVGRPSGAFAAEVSFVDNDNVAMGRAVADYLLKLGHEEILFLNAPRDRTVSRDRDKGLRQALAEAKVPRKTRLSVFKENDTQSAVDFGYRKTKSMIAANPEISAILADSDKVALGVYQACAEMKLRIPQDVSVFAFSVEAAGEMEFTPALSSVWLNGEQLGSEAAKLLLEQCIPLSVDRSIKRVVVPAELRVRASCAVRREWELLK